MRKYFTVDHACQSMSQGHNAAPRLTVVNLVEGNLGIMGQSLLSLGAQHEGFRLLGRHGCILGIHAALPSLFSVLRTVSIVVGDRGRRESVGATFAGVCVRCNSTCMYGTNVASCRRG